MEVNSNEYNGWYCAHCRCGVDPSEVTYHETHTVCGRYITDDEPTKGLTDLEVVQKALKTVGKYGGTLVLQDDGSCLIYEYPNLSVRHAIGFSECSVLLTWAKQTIGGE